MPNIEWHCVGGFSEFTACFVFNRFVNENFKVNGSIVKGM